MIVANHAGFFVGGSTGMDRSDLCMFIIFAIYIPACYDIV